MTPSRWSRLAAGARDTIPMVVGAAPFGLIFGTLAVASPAAPWQGQLMSLAVFAGSAQFIAIGLISAGAGLAVLWFTTLIVNLRHLLYSAALLPTLGGAPAGWRWLIAFLMTDETFAVVAGDIGRNPGAPHLRWYALGSGGVLYAGWQVFTAIGLVFGAAVPALQELGLEFAMVATFIAILVPQVRGRPHLAAALVAGGLALLLRGLPYNLGLVLAVLAGVAAGVALSRRPQAALP